MPDPHDTLSIFAEVSVALAGFSGVAIAFGRRSIGVLTPLEKRRLYNLIVSSGLVLILSLLGVSLLYVESIDPGFLWRGGSAVLVLTGIPWLIADWFKVQRLEPEERTKVPGYVIYTFTAIAVFILCLQIVNVFYLGSAWPFFVALVLHVLVAFQQFVFLIHVGVRKS
jgi:hypothetical protein